MSQNFNPRQLLSLFLCYPVEVIYFGFTLYAFNHSIKIEKAIYNEDKIILAPDIFVATLLIYIYI